MVAEFEGAVDVRLRAAVESSPSGLLMVDAQGRVVLVNREIERLFGYDREELLGHLVEELVPERYRHAHVGLRGGFFSAPGARAMGAERELFGLRKDGVEVPIEIGLTPITTAEGLFVISSIVDITARKAAEGDRRQLEDQLRQAQKMEALGRLAGGVAHDFNNILAAIVGYAELALEAAGRAELERDLGRVLSSATRGKELVERILRFSRRQEIALRPLDLAEVVTEAAQLLRATLPAAVEIRVQVEDEPPRVMADATAVHQILLNLANNAAQAMPAGGRLDIRLEPFYVRDSTARAHPTLREGFHVLLSVRDTGLGMNEATRARAFEPFFTTKPTGEGTGLGLALVHGIVRDHGGAVWLESAVGAGTTVSCALPALEAESAREPALAPGGIPRGRGEHVLLVDDEPALAELGQRRLQGLGYRATAATDPAVALELLRSAPAAYDLLITDFSMPGRNGLDLARAALAIRPGLPVLLLSGYMEEFPGSDLAGAGVRSVLKKPLSVAELATAVGDALRPP